MPEFSRLPEPLRLSASAALAALIAGCVADPAATVPGARQASVEFVTASNLDATDRARLAAVAEGFGEVMTSEEAIGRVAEGRPANGVVLCLDPSVGTIAPGTRCRLMSEAEWRRVRSRAGVG